MTEELSTLERWRLILGNAAATSLGGLGADAATFNKRHHLKPVQRFQPPQRSFSDLPQF